MYSMYHQEHATEFSPDPTKDIKVIWEFWCALVPCVGVGKGEDDAPMISAQNDTRRLGADSRGHCAEQVHHLHHAAVHVMNPSAGICKRSQT